MPLYLADKRTQKKLEEPTLLTIWISDKLSSNNWESLGISETKYLVSFIPLFHKRILSRAENAKKLGITYGALRNFLSEEVVKKLVRDNINEYAKFFNNRLLRKSQSASKLHDAEKVKIKLKGYEDFIEEAGTYYSKSLFQTISEKLFKQTASDKDSVREAAKLSYCQVLDAIGERFKEDGDIETYQKIRLQQLQYMLLNTEEYLKENQDKIGKGEKLQQELIDLKIRQIGYAAKLANQMYKEVK